MLEAVPRRRFCCWSLATLQRKLSFLKDAQGDCCREKAQWRRAYANAFKQRISLGLKDAEQNVIPLIPVQGQLSQPFRSQQHPSNCITCLVFFFLSLVLEGLIGHHRTVQVQLVWH